MTYLTGFFITFIFLSLLIWAFSFSKEGQFLLQTTHELKLWPRIILNVMKEAIFWPIFLLELFFRKQK